MGNFSFEALATGCSTAMAYAGNRDFATKQLFETYIAYLQKTNKEKRS